MNARGEYGNRYDVGNRRSVASGDPQYLVPYRNAAWVAARRGLRQRRVPALGYWRAGVHEKTYLFDSLDQAQSWYAQLGSGYDYAAVIDARDLARPVLENVGSGQRETFVGASIFQTPGAIQDELSDINEDFLAFSREITNEIERRGYPTKPGSENDPIVKIFTDAWSPLIQGWQAFYAGHKGWWGNLWWNSAPDAEAWHRKLIAMRADAKKKGMGVVSAEPEPYSRSVFDPHHDVIDTAVDLVKKGGEKAGEAWDLIKYGLYGVLAIGGVVALSSVVQNLRSNKDPAAKYVEFVARRTAPRGTATRARLSLGPGQKETP